MQHGFDDAAARCTSLDFLRIFNPKDFLLIPFWTLFENPFLGFLKPPWVSLCLPSAPLVWFFRILMNRTLCANRLFLTGLVTSISAVIPVAVAFLAPRTMVGATSHCFISVTRHKALALSSDKVMRTVPLLPMGDAPENGFYNMHLLQKTLQKHIPKNHTKWIWYEMVMICNDEVMVR